MSLGSVQRIRLFVEDWTGRFFPPGRNPFYFLGALSFFFLWIVLGTGVYLLLVYRMDIDAAYDSVQVLTEGQPYWGGIIRSLHRYATDGLMITMVLHGLRVFLADQYRGARWVAWVSGIVALGVIWGEGILGYWMVWDDRAQLIALKTAEFLDVLPIIGPSLPRAFLSRDMVTNLFFFVIIALHIAIPILMLILLWLHASRITRPVINPPRVLMLGVFASLLILSLLKPAISGYRADASRLPVSLSLDWFYLGPYPVLASISPGLGWFLVSAGAALLILIPWLGRPPRPRPQPVSLLLRRCNDCALCYQDCPYEAITMRPRTDGRPYAREASVDSNLCVSCGICVGSCTTSALMLPDYSLPGLGTEVKKRLLRQSAEQAQSPVAVLLCERAVPAGLMRSRAPGLDPIMLPCIGTIPPLVIEHAFKSSAVGVFLAACPEGDCHDRLGDRWLLDRLEARREPYLRRPELLSRIRLVHVSAAGVDAAIGEIDHFRKELLSGRELGARLISRSIPEPISMTTPSMRWLARVAAAVLLALPALLIFFFSGSPSYSFYQKDESLLVVSLKHTAPPRFCRELTKEEQDRLPPHMRTTVECTRERWPISLRLEIDDQAQLARDYRPSGLWSDGPAYVYQKFKLRPGVHNIRLEMREGNERPETLRSERIDFVAGRVVILP
jgi:ferredoxin/coenzyme F420-reducing hydrogenase delta subunit